MSELVDPRDRELILGSMRRWLAGEPIPTHDEILASWGKEFLMYRIAWDMGHHDHSSFERRMAIGALRDEAILEFGFAIPCRELLGALARYQPILEIGAGTGYLTALMRHHGIDVIGSNPAYDEYCFENGRYDPAQLRLEGKTAVRRYPDRTVFCSWPSLNATWFRQAMRAMRIGQRLIVIEEDACSEETTWAYRDAAFKHVENVKLPAWPYMNDRLSVWRRRVIR